MSTKTSSCVCDWPTRPRRPCGTNAGVGIARSPPLRRSASRSATRARCETTRVAESRPGRDALTVARLATRRRRRTSRAKSRTSLWAITLTRRALVRTRVRVWSRRSGDARTTRTMTTCVRRSTKHDVTFFPYRTTYATRTTSIGPRGTSRASPRTNQTPSSSRTTCASCTCETCLGSGSPETSRAGSRASPWTPRSPTTKTTATSLKNQPRRRREI